MKKKLMSILLVAISIITLLGLIGFTAISSTRELHGFPPFVVVNYEMTREAGRVFTGVDFRGNNVFVVFMVLSIPIFISGFLWKK